MKIIDMSAQDIRETASALTPAKRETGTRGPRVASLSHRLLELLAARSMTARELAEATRADRTKVGNALSGLAYRGHITYVNADSGKRRPPVAIWALVSRDP